MLRNLCLLLVLVSTVSINFAAGDRFKSQLGPEPTDEILFSDIDGDGDPDIMERWWNGRRCRWIDENDDMKRSDRRGDMLEDCLQIDVDKDGIYDSHRDMCIKWLDRDNDGIADAQMIVTNPKAPDDKKPGNDPHYMLFEDIDQDRVMAYFNWSYFGLESWRNSGKYNFSHDYNGNALFLKAHRPPYYLSDTRLNWENPFAFYDFDDDGCTEMAIRFVDDYPCDAKLDSAYITYDIDNDTQRDNEFDYDFSLYFAGGKKYDYSKHVHKYDDLKAADWVLPYFQHNEWRVIDELIYVGHQDCYDVIYDIDWGKCYFVFDEDDDDHRWERVEMYYPHNPYALKEKNSYSVLGGGAKSPMNGHPQADSLGDRGEFDMDNSGRGKLYFSKWDGRLHLYGAEWGAWILDKDAKYHNGLYTPSGSSKKMAKELEAVVLYKDTDKNGFFDQVTFDYDGDETPDMTVNLLEYGSDEFDLIDPAKLEWHGVHEAFKEQAKQAWQDAYTIYVAFWKTGLSNKEIDDLSFASSTWEKYFHGAKLKEAIFRKLSEELADDKKNLKQLHKYYFTGDFTGMALWIEALNIK